MDTCTPIAGIAIPSLPLPAGGMIRSNSLDSVSTAVSLGASDLSHSMDSLLLSNREPHRSRGQSLNLRSRRMKENGKVYDTLMEVSSILGAFSDAALEQEEGSECDGFTLSLQSDGRQSFLPTTTTCATEPAEASRAGLEQVPQDEGSGGERRRRRRKERGRSGDEQQQPHSHSQSPDVQVSDSEFTAQHWNRMFKLITQRIAESLQQNL